MTTPEIVPVTDDGIITVTHSDMQTYQQCPRAWWLRAVRRLRPVDTPVTGALPFGARIHKALEICEDQDTWDETSLRYVWDRLVEDDAQALLAVGWDTGDLESESRLGAAMLTGLIEWEDENGFHANWAVESVERRLSTDLLVLDESRPDIRVLMRGKADRVLVRRWDDARFLGDWKTAGNLSERELNGLYRSPQPRLYALLLRQELDDSHWVAGALFTVLRKVLRTSRANPPFYATVLVPMSEHDLEQYRLRAMSLASRMADDARRLLDGEDHRTVVHFAPGWWCASCPFKLPCNLMQDASLEAAEGLLAEKFKPGDPWERYSDGAV